MSKIVVSGLVNLETNVQIEQFPITYTAVRYPYIGVQTAVSAVGFNIAKALTTLGNDVRLLSLIGQDEAALTVRHALQKANINDDYVLSAMPQTAQSVVLYDSTGRRMINTDLKDVQERSYPVEQFKTAVSHADLAILANINFNRALLPIAQAAGVPIATDVHAIHALDDDYNQDFMAAATILFMSHEQLPTTPHAWAKQVQARFGTPLIVIGMGSEGALLTLPNGDQHHVPAVAPRPVVNTVGAGDALFSAFVHAYLKTADPLIALQQATLFAGYKIGESGGAVGFLTASELKTHFQRWQPKEE